MKLVFYLLCLLFFFGNVSAQQTERVDFKSIKAYLSFANQDQQVYGALKLTFEILESTDSIYLDAKNFKLTTPVNYIKDDQSLTMLSKVDDQKLWLMHPFKAKQTYVVTFDYSASPSKALYFIEDQIWTQGQGKYTSNWLPSIDDVNDKIEFDLKITYTSGFEVIANGKLMDKIEDGQNTIWSYDMQKPMPSYLVALAIGKYHKQTETSKSGIPLSYYFYPEDSLKAEPTYRYSKQMFDVLEEEIGVPFPWQNYKQVPVKDFLYSGMENSTLTIFSDSFVVDSIGFNDKNYITVNAHELAHQWFGDDVTASSGEHHWLQEGFATYYALLAERSVFGEDHYYWQLFEYAQELIAQEEAGESTALLNPKSSSTTFYKKGAWALHILREQVGDSAFQLAVKQYLEKNAYANVETQDFISEVEQASGFDLSQFEADWLTGITLPEDAMVKSLKVSEFMSTYFGVNCEVFSQKCKDYLVSNISDKAKIKVIAQMPNHVEAEVFATSLEVRQAISRYVQTISPDLKSKYETLLNDKSYLTIENALYNLWASFPEERVKYLEKTKTVMGFNDKNVRLLWLALHLNTLEYQTDQKQAVLEELIGYSLPDQHFEARMNAFNYLKLLGAWDKPSLSSLIEASHHHVWQFSKFAKNLIAELEADPNLKMLISEAKLKIKS
ncbi:M1 family metallopeptidase [Sediminibacter sp. Hel_I_10]|uniref:M1 family metallopeptidase n=1 Tax=Sediminibacter sp. Hel_I_10 TaxID=1392490 RepID=UPI00047CD8E2|nr:M1 family metallopeptidase [Sediminibacter sp. Hel_I_10]